MIEQSAPPEAAEPTGAGWQKASRRGAVHLAVVAGTTMIYAAVPMLFNHRFYYADDTQTSAVGAWYELGRRLMNGELPLLSPERWMAGNYVAEGQWSLFNPIQLVLALVTVHVNNLALVASVVKILAIMALGMGAYLVARSYAVPQRWAALLGMCAPFTGFSVYMDSASWVTGLFVLAALPWTWWALRRMRLRAGGPLLPFVFGYLLVTVGYVHGTMMLVVLILGCLLEPALSREWREVGRVLGVGALLGAIAVAVYLPGVLTSPVTWRTSLGIGNDNFMSPDLGALLTSTVPTATPWMTGFWKLPLVAPLMYVGWMLLLLVFVRWDRLAGRVRDLAVPVLLGVAAAMLVFGPSSISVIRFPVRFMPYLGLALLVLTVVVVSRAGLTLGRRRLLVLGTVTAIGAYLGFAKHPAGAVVIALGAVVAAGGASAVAWVSRRPASARLVGSAALVGLAAVVLQHAASPASPLPDYGLWARASDISAHAPKVSGSLLVAGSPTQLADPWNETAFGNAWYVAGVSTGNVYTPVGFAAYASDLCQEAHGSTCEAAAKRVSDVDPTTGLPLADLLSLDAVQVLGTDASTVASPPAGWHVQSTTPDSALWVRNTPVPSVGGIVWTSSGVTVHELSLSRSDTQVRFSVSAVPSSGGRVVLSRLAWPGYTVRGATEGSPLRGYLLQVDLAPSAVGTTVTVQFAPPAWTLSKVLVLGAPVATLLWMCVELIIRRRRRWLHGAHRTEG